MKERALISPAISFTFQAESRGSRRADRRGESYKPVEPGKGSQVFPIRPNKPQQPFMVLNRSYCAALAPLPYALMALWEDGMSGRESWVTSTFSAILPGR